MSDPRNDTAAAVADDDGARGLLIALLSLPSFATAKAASLSVSGSARWSKNFVPLLPRAILKSDESDINVLSMKPLASSPRRLNGTG